MRKTVFLFVMCVLLICLAGCSSSTSSTEEKEKTLLTIEQIAEKQSSTVGELNKIYRVDKSAANPDGSFIVLNLESIKHYAEYEVSSGEKLQNVVVLSNVTPVDQARRFVEEVGFFTLYDEYGEEYSNLSVGTQTNEEYSEIILISEEDISRYKYVYVGGLDKSRNDGEVAAIFSIN